MASAIARRACALHGSVVWAVPAATEKAAAESLFQDGVSLLQQGKAEAACEKFGASEELDPALGTMLRLADLLRSHRQDRERLGSVRGSGFCCASARRAPTRKSAARERVADIAKRLSRIRNSSPERRPTRPGDQVERYVDSVRVPLGTAPSRVDPGRPSGGGVRARFRDLGRVTRPHPPVPPRRSSIVPVLTAAPVAPQLAAAAAVPDSGPARSDRGQMQRNGGAGGRRRSAWRRAGWEYGRRVHVLPRFQRANHVTRASNAGPMIPNLCNPRGIDLRNQALSLAKVSTVTAIAGTVLLVGGSRRLCG